jgi:hypothetical protein
VTQHSPRTGHEHGGHPIPLARQNRMADGKDAAMDGMQSPYRQPVIDRPASEPEPEQLLARHHPVLAGRQVRDRPIH